MLTTSSVRIPLSPAQRRFWTGDQTEPSTFVAEIGFRFQSRLDEAALRAALKDLIERHESLRTVFPTAQGIPYQSIVETPSDMDLMRIDLSGRSSEHDVLTAAHDFVRRPTDIRSLPPVQPFVIDLGMQGHFLFLTVNHIIIDAWSVPYLFDDLLRAYYARSNGSIPTYREFDMQYSDSVIWNLRRLGNLRDVSSLYSRQLRFWKSRLGHLRESVLCGGGGCSESLVVSKTTTHQFDEHFHRRLLALADHRRVSLFAVLHAGFAALLSICGEDDSIIATAVSGRIHDALRPLVGLFENTVLLRVEARQSLSFGDLLGRAQQADRAAFDNADLPFADLIEELGLRQIPADGKLCEIVLVLQSTSETTLKVDGVYTTVTPGSSLRGVYDALFTFTEIYRSNGSPAGITCDVEFNAARMPHEAVYERIHCLEALLDYFSCNVDERLAVLQDLSKSYRSDGMAGSQPLSLKRRRLPRVTPQSLRAFVPPQNVLEDQIAYIFEDLLSVHPVGIWDDFLHLGGDLLLFDKLQSRMEVLLGRSLVGKVPLANCTIHALAEIVLRDQPSDRLVEIQSCKLPGRIPLFLVHGDIAGGGLYALELARGIGNDQSVYVLQQHGLDGRDVPTTVEDMAKDHVRTLTAFRSHGPYHLVGYCNGSLIVLEIANQLRDLGEQVASVIAIDPPINRNSIRGVDRALLRDPPPDVGRSTDVRSAWLFNMYTESVRTYTPRQYPGVLYVLWSLHGRQKEGRDLVREVEGYASEFRVHSIPGNHVSCVGRHVRECATIIRLCLSSQ